MVISGATAAVELLELAALLTLDEELELTLPELALLLALEVADDAADDELELPLAPAPQSQPASIMHTSQLTGM